MDRGITHLTGNAGVLRDKRSLRIVNLGNVLQSGVRDSLDLVSRNKLQATPDLVRDADSFVSDLSDNALDGGSADAIRS